MIGVDVDLRAKKHCTKFFEGGDDGQELFFHGCVVALREGELTGVVCDGATVLHDDGTKLKIGRVSVNVKR